MNNKKDKSKKKPDSNESLAALIIAYLIAKYKGKK